MVDQKVGFSKEPIFSNQNKLKKSSKISEGDFVLVPIISSSRGFHQKVRSENAVLQILVAPKILVS